ncbi:hypothetical protein ACVGWT_00625, partial [Enterobacter hormaechei]
LRPDAEKALRCRAFFCPVAVRLPGLPTPQKTRPLGGLCMFFCPLLLIAVLHILNHPHTNNRNPGHQANKKKL